MREDIIERMRRAGAPILGCHRGADNRCYYLTGTPFGPSEGSAYSVTAFSGESADIVQEYASFTVIASRSALATRRIQAIIGEPQTYLRRMAVAQMRAMLDGGARQGAHERLELHSMSPEHEWALPPTVNMRLIDQRIRDEILLALATHHDLGDKTVSRQRLFDHLCGDPNAIDRAIRILLGQGAIQVDEAKGFSLTDTGYLAAEQAVRTFGTNQAPVRIASQAEVTAQYDCFVSYAGEDRAVVRELVKALTDQDLQVWWDKMQIRVGDRLSQKIDEGLRTSRYGVVVISPRFLAKRWPETELRALVSRGINKAQKVVLPVLYEVTHDQFAEAYPLLADVVSTTFSGDYVTLAHEIVDAITKA